MIIVLIILPYDMWDNTYIRNYPNKNGKKYIGTRVNSFQTSVNVDHCVTKNFVSILFFMNYILKS